MSTNNFFEKKRGWSVIKDEIISHYLTPYINKVLKTRKPLTIIDCFAGKGVFDDGSIGSPVIIANKIKEVLEKNSTTDIKGIFIEKKYYDDLIENLKIYNNCEVRRGTFEEHIIDIIKKRKGSNIFLYIDPYGIKSLDFVRFKEICKTNYNTLEMLMNFNSFGFLREASRLLKYQNDFYIEKDLESYEVDEKNCIENMIRIAGGEYWLEILDDYNNNRISMHEAEQQFVEKYISRIYSYKLFKHVVNIPIKTKEKNIPKYRLIFATNHEDGLILMSNNMNSKWKKIIENERQGQLSLFDVGEGSIFSEAVNLYSFPDFKEEKNYNPREDIIAILNKEKKFVKLKSIIITLIKKYGIAYSTKNYVDIIKELEKDEIIDIYRNPPYTKEGRLAKWYDINKDIRVRIKMHQRKVTKFIERKSLLYKTKVEYGDYTINHVLGCSHGCMYPCYAMMLAKRFGNVKTYEEWIEPSIVKNAVDLLKSEIPKYKDKIKFVHLCFTTDPFMYGYKEISDLSISLIKILNENNIKCTALSKGLLPKELIKLSKDNEFGITIVSLNEEFRKKYEPFSAMYEDRIKNLKFLHDNGIKTWASIEPYPTPNIVEQKIEDILEKIKFVDKIIFGRLNYNSLVKKYKNYKDYYNEISNKVIEFCNKENIKWHIKEGTITGK